MVPRCCFTEVRIGPLPCRPCVRCKRVRSETLTDLVGKTVRPQCCFQMRGYGTCRISPASVFDTAVSVRQDASGKMACPGRVVRWSAWHLGCRSAWVFHLVASRNSVSVPKLMPPHFRVSGLSAWQCRRGPRMGFQTLRNLTGTRCPLQDGFAILCFAKR